MADVRMPYALDQDQRLVHVNDVQRGAAAGCACPAGGQPVWAKPGDELSRHFAHAVATEAPAPPNQPSTWRPKRWSHRASTKPGTATAPTQYGYAVNADTRQARCPSQVNTSLPKPNGNPRATRAATS